MKYYIYKITFVLCLAFAFTTGRAADEAIFKSLKKEYTLHPDGSQEVRVYKELLFLSHMSFNSLYGETFIIYNPDYQKITFNECYTRQADGNIVKAPANAFNEVLPFAAANAPAYNHLKEMVVTHTGLEIGATVFLDYTLTTKSGYYPALDIDEILQELTPVNSYDLSIKVPENTVLNKQLTGSGVKPNVKTENGYTTYRWVLKNIPASSKEGWLPENKNGIPRLTAHTYPSNAEALKYLGNKLSPGTSETIKQLAVDLTKDAADEFQKIQMLHAYVVNKTALSGLNMEQIGYTFRTPEEVYRTAYGTSTEKLIFFAALCDAAGIPYTYTVSYPGTLADNSSGLKPIKNLAVRVNYIYYMPTTTSTTAFSKRGELDTYYLIENGNGNKLYVESKDETETAYADTLNASTSVTDGYIIYALKNINEGVRGWGMNRLNSKRKEILEIPSVTKEKKVWNITLDAGMVLQTPLEEIRLNETPGNLYISIKQEGNTVTITREIELNEQQILPSEYAAFRKLMAAWYNPKWDNLIIEKK